MVGVRKFIEIMKERVLYLDILRIAATFGVLFNHIPLAAVHIFDKQATDVDRFLVNGNVHVMHFAVPLFVMITGALLLQPERKIDYRKVLTKYAWRMVVILALVGTAFAWMEMMIIYSVCIFIAVKELRYDWQPIMRLGGGNSHVTHSAFMCSTCCG